MKTKQLKVMSKFYLIGLYLYSTKGASKIYLIAITALTVNPFLETINKYIIPDRFDNYAIFLILLILDTLSGVFKHSGLWHKKMKTKSNTLDKDEFFHKLLRKVFAGSVWLILVNMINKMDNTSGYFDMFGISVLLSWLGWSIASNLYVITGSTFPPEWVMKKLRNANEKEDKDINTHNQNNEI